jgi:multicomponent Na+:H+ antiporter subunit D
MIDAMVAPHPISALIHGLVVVKAGVICLLKISFYIYGADYLKHLVTENYVMLLLPFATVIYGGLGALYAKNLKTILAFSTTNNASLYSVAILTSK